MAKTAAEKGRIKPGAKVAIVNPEPEIVASVGLQDPVFTAAPDAHLIFLFVHTRAELEAGLPAAVEALAPGAAIWVFFRKGSKAAGVDVNRDDIWSAAEKLRLRPLGLLSIDELWSAFRLRPGA
jgi:hypothetical protein